MQISTLNKVINLFLIGLFFFFLAMLVEFERIRSYMELDSFKNLASSLSSPVAIIVITFFLLSSALVGGLLVDAATNIVRGIILPTYENENLARFFRYKEQLRRMQSFRDKYTKALKLSRYKAIAGDITLNRSLAVGILFQTAKSENIEWDIQHYSIYLLATNYALLFAISLVFLLSSSHSVILKLIFSLCDFVAIYLLLHRAISSYHYLYEVNYRHACLILCEEQSSAARQPRGHR